MKPQAKTKPTAIATVPAFDSYRVPGHLIRRLHQASQAIFDIEVSAAGIDLTSVQFAALNAIAARPGLDQATLAREIGFDRPTTGGVIDRLEAKGFVRRIVSREDRRARELYAEPAGLAVLERVIPIVHRVQDLIVQGLSPTERTTFQRLLTKALEAVGDVSR